MWKNTIVKWQILRSLWERDTKKAVELGFADGILHGKEDTEEDAEGLMFSRTAVTNSLLTKLIPKKPEAKVPIEQLEKRLQLLSH